MCLLGCLSSWAEGASLNFDFEDANANALFTGDSRITVAIEEDATLSSNVVGFTCASNAQNGYSFAHYDFSSIIKASTTKVTIDLDYYNTNGGRAILTIGDASVRGTTGGSSKTTYSNIGAIFAVGSNRSYALINGANKTLGNFTNKWMHVRVVVDVVNKKHSYTVTQKSDDTILGEATDQDYYGTATTCSQIDLFGYINNSHCAMIDNISIETEESSATPVNYTVKYVDESNNEIKKQAVRQGLPSTSISLTAADKESFKNNDETIKYIYKEDNSEGATVAGDGSSVVTVVFREAAQYSYTVNAVVDGTKEPLAVGTTFEGDAVTVFYPKYINNGGTLYTKAAISNAYNYTFTPTENATVVDLEYSSTSNDNIVFFSEAEKLDGVSVYEDSYTNIRMSDGVAGYFASQTAIVNLPAGVYTITSATRAGTTTFYAGSTEVGSVKSDGSFTETTSAEFTLTENTDISVSAGSNKAYFDYVFIRKTKDIHSVTINASAATGATTLYLDYPVAIAEGTTAWYASAYDADADKLTMTQLTDYIPAKTGVVIVGTAGQTYTFEETSETVAAVENNKLEGQVTAYTEETFTTSDGWYYLALSGNFKKYEGTATKNAYKAYLNLTERPWSVSIKDITLEWSEATGISEIATNKPQTARMYNIAGQKVSAPVKGNIYIVNGKKVMY